MVIGIPPKKLRIFDNFFDTVIEGCGNGLLSVTVQGHVMLGKRVQNEIESITHQLVDLYGAEKVILFGSAAHGMFDTDSDLDFLIIKKEIPYYGKDRLLELDRLIKYSLPTDMLVYRPDELQQLLAEEDPFIKMILAEGKVLHG